MAATLKPGTWRGELTSWIQQPGNGRKRSWGPENMPCCPQDKGYVHNAWKKNCKSNLRMATETILIQQSVSESTGIQVFIWCKIWSPHLFITIIQLKNKDKGSFLHWWCFDICSIRDFGAVHTDTLETTVCVNAHLVLCAVVLSGGTLINVCDQTETKRNIDSNKKVSWDK